MLLNVMFAEVRPPRMPVKLSTLAVHIELSSNFFNNGSLISEGGS